MNGRKKPTTNDPKKAATEMPPPSFKRGGGGGGGAGGLPKNLKKKQNRHVEATVEEADSDRIVKTKKKAERRKTPKKEIMTCVEGEDHVPSTYQAVTKDEAATVDKAGRERTHEEDPVQRSRKDTSADPVADTPKGSGLDGSMKIRNQTPGSDSKEQEEEKTRKRDKNKEENGKTFLNEEGHPILSQHVKTLSTQELVMLDNYLRKQRALRHGDAINSQKDRYTIITKINEGRFSAVYLVESKETEEFYALKTEMRKSNYQKRLKNELAVLTLFNKSNEAKNKMHFPKLIDMGRSGEITFIIMSLLGTNLEKIRKDMGGSFTKLGALYLMFETLKAVRDVHSFNFIHRDIKLSNFCAGFEEKYKRIFIIDFGSAKKFESKPQKTRNSLIGSLCADDHTLYYASMDVHKGDPPCRRTDLESWFYMSCDLLAKDSLPWREEQGVREVCEMKEKFFKEGGGEALQKMPFANILKEILEHIYALKYGSEPDYKKMREWIRKAIDQTGVMDDKFNPEWHMLNKQ